MKKFKALFTRIKGKQRFFPMRSVLYHCYSIKHFKVTA